MNDMHEKMDSRSVRCPICDQDHVPGLTCLQAWLTRLKTESEGNLNQLMRRTLKTKCHAVRHRLPGVHPSMDAGKVGQK